jgi:hypothetical protein
MGTIEKITSRGKDIYIIDYSGCKESEMIELVSSLKTRIVTEGKRVSVLTVFDDRCYATPAFMRRAEKETQEALSLVEKQAMTGLNETKKMILRGYNFLFGKNIQSFDTRESALQFLIDEDTSDEDKEPWDRTYLK